MAGKAFKKNDLIEARKYFDEAKALIPASKDLLVFEKQLDKTGEQVLQRQRQEEEQRKAEEKRKEDQAREERRKKAEEEKRGQWAKSMYITDRIEVGVRSEAGIEKGIVGMVKTGDRVVILEGDNTWSKIRMADGTVGWIASRFLVDQINQAPFTDTSGNR